MLRGGVPCTHEVRGRRPGRPSSSKPSKAAARTNEFRTSEMPFLPQGGRRVSVDAVPRSIREFQAVLTPECFAGEQLSSMFRPRFSCSDSNGVGGSGPGLRPDFYPTRRRRGWRSNRIWSPHGDDPRGRPPPRAPTFFVPCRCRVVSRLSARHTPPRHFSTAPFLACFDCF